MDGYLDVQSATDTHTHQHYVQSAAITSHFIFRGEMWCWYVILISWTCDCHYSVLGSHSTYRKGNIQKLKLTSKLLQSINCLSSSSSSSSLCLLYPFLLGFSNWWCGCEWLSFRKRGREGLELRWVLWSFYFAVFWRRRRQQQLTIQILKASLLICWLYWYLSVFPYMCLMAF